MKILMIAPTPFFADRGCHTQIYEEIKALQKLGHEIKLCTYGLGRDIAGVTTVRCPNLPWYKKLSAGPSKTKFLLLPLLAITAFKTTRSFKPDVIHGHLHEGAVIARFLKFFFPSVAYVFDMQGTLTEECIQHGFFKRGTLVHRFFMAVERRIANWFFVVTQSNAMVAELDRLGVDPSRVANVKDGVDTDIFRPLPVDTELAKSLGIDPTRTTVLYMGLLETYQGADLLMEAFSRVAALKPETQFIVIGYPNVEKYQTVCAEKGIGEKVQFLGRVDYTKLTRYLTLSEIAVAPKIALTEGDGKIYNYMAMGMCTVAFDRSTSREILGDTGVFAKFGDAEDLAAKILWAIENPAERRKLGAESRQRALDTLSWDAVGRRIDRVYNRLTGPAEIHGASTLKLPDLSQ